MSKMVLYFLQYFGTLILHRRSRDTFYGITRQYYAVYLQNVFSLPFVLSESPILTSRYTGPLFTKQADVLPQDLVKSRSRETRV